MSWQAWFTIAVVVLMFLALWRNVLSAEFIVFGALVLLVLARVITIPQSVAGFSNRGMLTVAALFVVAGAVQQTGALTTIAHRFLGASARGGHSLLRIMLPASLVSPFLNNTPIVAIFTPIVRDWAKRNNIAPSKVLIPLSYATILGGMCTLIGTSTNLIVNGMIVERGLPSMTMFELAKVGLPCLAAGIIYFLVIGRRLLPDRRDLIDQLGDERREYTVEMEVKPNCPYAGQSISKAGLRHLSGLFLAEIEREGEMLAPVGPNDVIQAGDRLVFFGLASTVVDLQKMKGLIPATDQHYKLSPEERRTSRLYEVVISPQSPLAGSNLRDAHFRRRYDAVVIAVHRNGERIKGKIGDIVIQPGDTLLLEGAKGFARVWYNSTDFYLISEVSKRIKPDYEKAPVSLAVLAVMVVVFSIWPKWIVAIAFAAAFAMVVLKCVSSTAAKQSIDLSVIVVIASALGVGRALENSGAASAIAGSLLHIVKFLGPLGALAVIYGLTTFFTEVITNNAAAALVVPIALSTASQLGVSPRPFIIAVAIAASASFATPIGYQTNLIVYGPGGYKFSDFLKVGLPMNLLIWIVAVCVIPIFWPF